MLLTFKTKNLKSFEELASFSMAKGRGRLKDERIANFEDGVGVLKFASIFGANASGKSNLVRALRFMQFILVQGFIPSDAVNEYYKLDEEDKNKPSYFEVVISLGKVFYSYGFEISLRTGIVESEWLVALKKTASGIKESAIFERTKNRIELKKLSNKLDESRLMRLNVYKEDVEAAPNRLFLNYLNATRANLLDTDNEELSAIRDVFGWFKYNLVVAYPTNSFVTADFVTSVDKLNRISSLLKACDTGVERITEMNASVEQFTADPALGINYPIYQNELIQRQRLSALEGKLKTEAILIKNQADFWVLKLDKNRNFSVSRLLFVHNGKTSTQLNLLEESDGTLRLFELAEPVLAEDGDKTYVIDELDRCLHPTLTVAYVRLFLNRASIKENKNQLIVTTHESRLLDLDLLRRDEVWFVEKKEGRSHLYSLEEFNERFDKVIDKAYLNGRYGGVPVFDSIFFPEFVKLDEN